ncbi:glycosyltransferase family 2 protein [candidate division KSB1 bacterium]|nr:glycosyltransferase family 2 protein [candidate division KSB1 bacterium]
MSTKNNGFDSYRITVIIVTFNNIGFIVDCLRSLSRALHGNPAQVLIIDNHSTDGTAEYLNRKELSAEFEFSGLNVILNNKNAGFTYAVNQGLRQSQGDYILLLNPDVFLQSDTLSVLLNLFRDKKIGAAAPQLRYPDGQIQKSCRRFPQKKDVIFEMTGLTKLFSQSAVFNNWKMADFTHRESRFVDQPQGAFLLTTKEVFSKVGLFDTRFPMFFSDVDWCYRAVRNNCSIYFCADTFACHLKGASVYQQRSDMIVSSHRSFVDFFHKYDLTFFDRVYTALIYFLLLLSTLPRLLFAAVSQKS